MPKHCGILDWNLSSIIDFLKKQKKANTHVHQEALVNVINLVCYAFLKEFAMLLEVSSLVVHLLAS